MRDTDWFVLFWFVGFAAVVGLAVSYCKIQDAARDVPAIGGAR